jgi:hypothetical protein
MKGGVMERMEQLDLDMCIVRMHNAVVQERKFLAKEQRRRDAQEKKRRGEVKGGYREYGTAQRRAAHERNSGSDVQENTQA